jgi:hypothetical protein
LADSYIASAVTWNGKQAALVSGTNIKTINGNSVLGSGDLTISGSNIYTADGTLSADRTVTSNGNSLTILGGKETFAGYQRSLWLKTSTTAKSSVELILENTFTTTGRMYEIASYSDGTFNITDRTNSVLRLKIDRDYFQFHSSSTSNANLLGKVAGINALWFNQTSATATTSNYTLCSAPSLTLLNAPTGGSIYFRVGNSDRALLTNGGNLLIGTTTDAGFKLDVNGTARVQNNLSITNGFNLTYGANAGIKIGEGASIPSLPSSSMIAIGNNARVSMTLNFIGAGIAIGHNSEVSFSGIAIGPGAKISGGVNINSGDNLARSGTFINSSFGSTASTGAVLINGSATNAGISDGNSQSQGVTINGTNNGGNSVAISAFVPTGEKGVFVVGAPNDNNNFGDENTAISNVYFGSGISRTQKNGTVQRTGFGWPYTINGSGARGTDFAGGNITIAGGKGTGAGAGGDVIFSTATPTTTGTTLQTLTQRWFIKGSSGILANTSTPNASAQLQVDSTTQGFLPPRMTNAQRLAIATPAVGLMVYCTDMVEGLYVNKSTGWTFVI